MAVRFNAVNDGLIRNSGAFLNNTDWSVMYKVKLFTDYPTNPDYRTIWLLGDPNYVNPYVFQGNNQDGKLSLDVLGVTGSTQKVSNGPAALSRWYDILITYNNSTNTINYYIDGWLIHTAGSVELNGAAFAEERLGFDGSAFSHSNIEVEYYRSWTSIITPAEYALERVSSSAVKASPFVDTPLVSDLLDDSGNGRDWTANGSIEFVTGSTLLAAPPINTIATSAIEIFQGDTIFQNVRSGGIANEVWYKYTALTTDIVVGIFAIGYESPGYRARLEMYTGPASSPVAYPVANQIVVINKPSQIQVVGGTTYFIKIEPVSSASDPAILKISCRSFDCATSVAGSPVITNDTPDADYPATVVNPTTGEVTRMMSNFPVGEHADAMQSNSRILAEDLSTGDHKLMTSAGTPIYTIPVQGSNWADGIRAHEASETFFASLLAKQVAQIDGNTGAVIQQSTVTSTGSIVGAVAPNSAGNLLYYADQLIGSPVYIWNWTANTAEPNLASGIAGYRVIGILTLPGDTDVLVGYFDPNDDFFVRRYNSSGVMQVDYPFTGGFDGQNPKMSLSITAGAFWVKYHDPNGTETLFVETRVSDGATLQDISTAIFNQGGWAGTANPTPPSDFGVDDTCSFFVLPEELECGGGPVPNSGSGIYQLIPGQTYDEIYLTLDPTTTEERKIP